MDPRLLAKLIAAGRLVIGTALVAKPEAVTGPWVGSRNAGTRVMASGLGIRDVAMGAGVLAALRGGSGARPWLVGSALADLGDLAGVLRDRGELNGLAVAFTTAMAGGSAALGFWLAAQDDFA
jgi:hypothetical protein